MPNSLPEKHNKLISRRRTRGQGLVEYAIIIALVAIVVIVVASLIGFSTKRNFGLLAGIFGTTRGETVGSTSINISSAQCMASISQNKVGIWVLGSTSAPLSELTASTDTGLFSSVSANGAGFIYNPLVADPSTDLGRCPKGVTIQTKNGATAFAPLVTSTIP